MLTPVKAAYFTACFGTEEPLETCGPELKTKLHDPFEPFSTSYHALVVNRVSEVSLIICVSIFKEANTFLEHKLTFQFVYILPCINTLVVYVTCITVIVLQREKAYTMF